MQKFNLHSHTEFCDGKGSIEENIISAIKKNFSTFGFSSHAPLKFDNKFSLPYNLLPKYIEQIELAKIKYQDDISIFKGLECDYIPNLNYSFAELKEKFNLDYIIGGVHLVSIKNSNNLWFIDGSKRESYDNGLRDFYNNDIKSAVKSYFNQIFEMINYETFDILAHVDKIKMHNANRFFSEDEKWYRNLCYECVSYIAEKDIIMEINSRGIYKKRCPDFYPSHFVLKEAKQKNVRITLSSDCHTLEEQDLLLNEAALFAKSVGYSDYWTLTKLGWQPVIL